MKFGLVAPSSSARRLCSHWSNGPPRKLALPIRHIDFPGLLQARLVTGKRSEHSVQFSSLLARRRGNSRSRYAFAGLREICNRYVMRFRIPVMGPNSFFRYCQRPASTGHYCTVASRSDTSVAALNGVKLIIKTCGLFGSSCFGWKRSS